MYRWKKSGEVAFTDLGERIEVCSSRNKVAIKSALQVAKEKGWGEVRVEGDLNFRRDTWLQGSLIGVKVKGYQANEIDRAKLQELQREKYRREQIYEKERFKDLQELRKKLAEEKKQREQKREQQPTVEHVKAPADKMSRHMRAVMKEIDAERDKLIDERETLGFDSKLRKYPEPMTPEQARVRAREEIGGEKLRSAREENLIRIASL